MLAWFRIARKVGASKVQNPLNSCNRNKPVMSFYLDSGGEQLFSVDKSELFSVQMLSEANEQYTKIYMKDVGVLK